MQGLHSGNLQHEKIPSRLNGTLDHKKNPDHSTHPHLRMVVIFHGETSRYGTRSRGSGIGFGVATVAMVAMRVIAGRERCFIWPGQW